jgi:hypothetical protein
VPRYRLQLPIILEWRDDAGAHIRGCFTSDVNVKGGAAHVHGCSPCEYLCRPASNVAASSRTASSAAAGIRRVARLLGPAEGIGVVIAAELNVDVPVAVDP